MINTKIVNIRRQVYKNGFYVIKNFVKPNDLKQINRFWLERSSYDYISFVKNVDLTKDTLPYFYSKPTDEDSAFCYHIFNKPSDELSHEYAFEIQRVRNSIEGNSSFFGLTPNCSRFLQYRVCRSLSKGQIVKKHADFYEEFRADPTGDHSFDPSRLQATLFLSSYGKDYVDGGFKLWVEDNRFITFGKDVEVNAGDLVFWRYSIPHEVSDINAKSELGFMRIIYPMYDRR